MRLRIDNISDGRSIVLRLIGRIRSARFEELEVQNLVILAYHEGVISVWDQ